MTRLGQMLYDDGLKAGKSEGRIEGSDRMFVSDGAKEVKGQSGKPVFVEAEQYDVAKK